MNKMQEVDFWGYALQRWPSSAVENMGLSLDDENYLMSVGLPLVNDWNFALNLPASNQKVETERGMIHVAFDGPIAICLNSSDGGIVVAIEESKTRRVNLNVRRFGYFLMLFQNYRLRVQKLSEEEAELLIDEIEEMMSECDPEFMNNSDDYWPIIIEQMRAGLI